MSHVIEAVGFASGVPCPHAGMYLRAFDHEAHGGQGEGVFTNDLDQAMRFADSEAAFSFWRRVSRIRPVRPDGKPNRPLTALTIVVVDLDVEKNDAF